MFAARAQELAAAARRDGRLADALKLCSDALDAAVGGGASTRVQSDVLCERSAVHLAVGDAERALEDARAAASLERSAQVRPGRLCAAAVLTSRKRLGSAGAACHAQTLLALGQALSAVHSYVEAERAFAAGLQLDTSGWCARCLTSDRRARRGVSLAVARRFTLDAQAPTRQPCPARCTRASG